MQVVIVTHSFSPFTVNTRGSSVAALAMEMASLECHVKVVMPLCDDAQNGGVPLARRLSKIRVNRGDDVEDVVRYDARTPSGVDVFLLDLSDDLTPEAKQTVFASAACQLIGALESSPDICWLIDVVPPVMNQLPTNCARVLSLSSPETTAAMTDDDAVDAVIIHKRALAHQLMADESSSTGQRLARGETLIFPDWPLSVIPMSAHKPSTKLQIQTDLGLPVTEDVPLCLMSHGVLHGECQRLLALVKYNVQMLLPCTDGRIDGLGSVQEDYPDRLVVLDESVDVDRLLLGCDVAFCATSADVQRALSRGVLPVVTEEDAGDAVPLSPDLQSGSAVVYRDGGLNALRSAMGDAMGFFLQTERFTALQQRLPEYNPDVATVGAKCVALFQSLSSQKTRGPQ